MAFDFEKLDVYQEAPTFADSVYDLSAKFPKDESYGLTGQVRRAAVSVALDIAEGSGKSKKEFIRYLKMARASVHECVPLLTLANRQGYIEHGGFEEFYGRCESPSRMLSKLVGSLRRV